MTRFSSYGSALHVVMVLEKRVLSAVSERLGGLGRDVNLGEATTDLNGDGECWDSAFFRERNVVMFGLERYDRLVGINMGKL
jgi:hypothetical protein